MNMRICKALLVSSMLGFGSVALADDTDIYIENNAPPGSEPLVMFSLDHRANLTATYGGCTRVGTTGSYCSVAQFFADAGLAADLPPATASFTFYDALRLTLKLVLSQVDGVKIGLMYNHNQENNCAGNKGLSPPTNQRCSNGGAILMGFQTLNNGTRNQFNQKLLALQTLKAGSSSADHAYQGKELFFEFFRYLKGKGVYNGHNGWSDYEQGGSVDKTTAGIANMRCGNSNSLLAKACFDTTIEDATNTNYISPLTGTNACTKIYTINFMFQVSQQEADSDAAITASAASGGMAGINLSGNNNSFDTVIEYLNDTDLSDNVTGVQNVTSYFIVDPTKINQTTRGYARAGGTGSPLPLSENPGELVDALTNIFKQILSVSTTFVAASVPVNVFNRATVIDNVYIALFQADAGARPSWNGNVKKLKLRETTLTDGSKDQVLFDANGSPAVATDGRIQFDALTFWTNPSALTDADPDEQISAGRDGRHVSRGGAGQKIPGFLGGTATLLNSAAGARQLYFNDGANMRALNADAATATSLRTALGAATDAEALDLIKFARGQDINNVDGDPDGNTTDARPWLMGDPLHSRPLPINYGTVGGYSASNPGIFIAVGSNDGFMHFFRNTSTSGTELGDEVWAFMPKEVMGIQKTLAKNDPVTNPKHPYGVDGSAAAFQDPATGKTYLYFGLRRGGRSMYALDVSTPTAAPILKWKISRGDAGFEELGLTFSSPQVGYVKDSSGTKVPAVFFSGGYDPDNDYETPNNGDTEGRALYIVNAITGDLIWRAQQGGSTGKQSNSLYTHAELVDSIASDLTIADTDGDDIIDRVLVGDVGGNVWRADINATIGESKLVLLAKLGYHGDGTGKANDRRFFHAVDLVQTSDADGNSFDAVLVGSGDREDPLDKSGVAENYFFMIKDPNVRTNTGTDLAHTISDLTDISDNTCLVRGTLEECGVVITNGWKLELQEGTGEKVLATATTFGNTVFFTTYLPPRSSEAATCGPSEGGGALYAISLEDGAAAFNFDRSDDASGDTTGEANSLGDRTDPLASGGIPAQVVFIPTGDSGLSYIRPDLTIETPPRSNRFRTFWQRVEN